MMKMKQVYRILLLIIIASLIIVLSTTYGYWEKKIEQSDSSYMKSLCLDVSIIKEEDDILLNKAYPIDDEEGLKLKPYKFIIKNNCETTAKYSINFELLKGTNLSDKYIAISLNGKKNGILSELEKTTTTIENALSDNSGYSLEEGTINGGEEKSYELRLWMDKSITVEDVDSMNKTLKGKITLIAEYTPQLEVENELIDWGHSDTIKIHGYSKYHNLVAYSITKEKGEYNWKNIEGKREINIEEEIEENGKYYVSIKDAIEGISTKEIIIDKIDKIGGVFLKSGLKKK